MVGLLVGFGLLGIVGVGGLALVGSISQANQRERLTMEVQRLESRRQHVASEVSVASQRVETARSRLTESERELARVQQYAERYAEQHPYAVAAVFAGAAGGTMALDADDVFSEDWQEFGGAVAIVAVTYCLFNSEDCSAALDVMNRTQVRVQELEREIGTMKQRVIGLQGELDDAQVELRSFDGRLQSKRAELGAL